MLREGILNGLGIYASYKVSMSVFPARHFEQPGEALLCASALVLGPVRPFLDAAVPCFILGSCFGVPFSLFLQNLFRLQISWMSFVTLDQIVSRMSRCRPRFRVVMEDIWLCGDSGSLKPYSLVLLTNLLTVPTPLLVGV